MAFRTHELTVEAGPHVGAQGGRPGLNSSPELWAGRTPRRLVRVPPAALMTTASEAPVARLAATPSASASSGSRAAYVVREAVMLVMFVVTLAATYYLGRTHAFQNVIVVPEPWSRHSTLS